MDVRIRLSKSVAVGSWSNGIGGKGSCTSSGFMPELVARCASDDEGVAMIGLTVMVLDVPVVGLGWPRGFLPPIGRRKRG